MAPGDTTVGRTPGCWSQSVAPKTKIESVITEDALATLSEKLTTPLQFEYYLTRALEDAYKVGQKPVGADIDRNCARQGY